jgi:hypothetical protein
MINEALEVSKPRHWQKGVASRKTLGTVGEFDETGTAKECAEAQPEWAIVHGRGSGRRPSKAR